MDRHAFDSAEGRQPEPISPARAAKFSRALAGCFSLYQRVCRFQTVAG